MIFAPFLSPSLYGSGEDDSVSGLHYVFKPRLVVGAEYKVDYYEGPGPHDPDDLVYYDFDRHGVRIAVR